jgi:phosphoglycerate kinase
MHKSSIEDLHDIKDKKVLIRVDFNVPIQDGIITDDSRIKAALPTLNYILERGGTCIVATHLGRPKGQVIDELRLNLIAKHLKSLIHYPMLKLNDCVGDSVQDQIQNRTDIKVFLLENLRFYNEETQNDTKFAKQLASLADIFVQDAFGVVHRAHASTEGVSQFLPSFSGLLVNKELNYLQGALSDPKRPFIAIVGGSKVSTKLGVLKHLLDKVDELIIGGAMAFTFLKALGFNVGKSLCEDDKCDIALELIEKANQLNKHIILPKDVVVSDDFKGNGTIEIVSVDAIPAEMMGLDIGPVSLAEIKQSLEKAQTVIWNGPLGVFEVDAFSNGTCEVARALADSAAISIVGGGDSVAAVNKTGVSDKMDHISTGGGACLEFLEGKTLPGIACLKERV